MCVHCLPFTDRSNATLLPVNVIQILANSADSVDAKSLSLHCLSQYMYFVQCNKITSQMSIDDCDCTVNVLKSRTLVTCQKGLVKQRRSRSDCF